MAAPGWMVALSARLYRGLLVAYPPAFRREYGPDMAQVFRDCCRDMYLQAGVAGMLGLWSRTVADLAASGLHERLTERAVPPAGSLDLLEGSYAMEKQSRALRLLPYALTVLFGLALAYVNLHTDEVPFVAIPLLGATFVLGFAFPRGAWRWALLTMLWVPLSQVWAWALGMHVPYPNHLEDVPGVLIPVALFAFPGAYLGVLGRWVLGRLADEAPGTPR